MLKSTGNSFNYDLFESAIGFQALEMARVLLSTTTAKLSEEQLLTLVDCKNDVYSQLLTREQVSIMPGVRKWLNYFSREHIPQAIVSSTTRRNICAIMGGLNIGGHFRTIVSAEDVDMGKPAPDPFLLASAQLCAERARCIVLEDTAHGIRAAKLAGMYCIAVTTTQNRESLKDADLVLDSLDGIQPESIFIM